MNKSIQFVSGMPRSGSTLLMNLLGQCPSHYVTPTNSLAELVVNVRQQWVQSPPFRAQGLEEVEPRIINLMKGMIQGFYSQELKSSKIVFDKSRAWIYWVDLLDKIFGEPVDIIVTIRDPREIAGSWVNVCKESVMTSSQSIQFRDTDTLVKNFFSPQGIAGQMIQGIRNAQVNGYGDRLKMISYKSLCDSPIDILNSLHDVMGINHYTQYNPSEVKQITVEDDSDHLFKNLHKVRSSVEYKYNGWKEVLHPSTVGWVENNFKDMIDINQQASQM